MLLIVDGRVSVSLRLPGDRAVEVASAGARARCSARSRCSTAAGTRPRRASSEPTSLLSLSRADFAALVSRRHPTAFALKRRIAGVACARLRQQLAGLAASLGGGAAAEAAAAAPSPTSSPAGRPTARYVRRLRDASAPSTRSRSWGFLTAGPLRAAARPAARSSPRGRASPACYLTINGAVEKVIVRGGRRIRVGLAGPGQAFGYESLIDGEPSPVTAATRERTLLLVLPQEAFERLFNGETTGSHVVPRRRSTAT